MRNAQRVVFTLTLTLTLAVRIAGVVRVAAEMSVEDDFVTRRVLALTLVPMGLNPTVSMKMS